MTRSDVGDTALGVEAGPKSEAGRICGELDAGVAAFRSRSLVHTAYLFVSATYLKARVDGAAWQRCRSPPAAHVPQGGTGTGRQCHRRAIGAQARSAHLRCGFGILIRATGSRRIR